MSTSSAPDMTWSVIRSNFSGDASGALANDFRLAGPDGKDNCSVSGNVTVISKTWKGRRS